MNQEQQIKTLTVVVPLKWVDEAGLRPVVDAGGYVDDDMLVCVVSAQKQMQVLDVLSEHVAYDLSDAERESYIRLSSLYPLTYRAD